MSDGVISHERVAVGVWVRARLEVEFVLWSHQ